MKTHDAQAADAPRVQDAAEPITIAAVTSSMAATTAGAMTVAVSSASSCGADRREDPAHLIPRSLGGCGINCVHDPCEGHATAPTTGGELTLPLPRAAWRAQIAHAVGNVA